jgi:hypothetical protein
MIKNLCIMIPLGIVQLMALKLGWYFAAGMVLGAAYLAGVYFGEKA